METRELDHVIYEKDGPIARIILNNPDRANAQTSEMVLFTVCSGFLSSDCASGSTLGIGRRVTNTISPRLSFALAIA